MLKKIKNIFIASISLLFFSSINLIGMQSKINNNYYQYQAPGKYANANFKVIAPYFIQNDPFSCGYRAAFHAVAFENALKSGDFKNNVRSCLANSNLLHNNIYGLINKNSGLNNLEIDHIVQKYGIGNKLAVLGLENGKFSYLGKIYISWSGNISQAQKNQMFSQKKAQLLSQQLNGIYSQLKGPNRSGYFVCTIGNHWILLSIITDNNGQATLYMIDSNIRPIGHNDCIFIDHFLGVVNNLNSGKAQQNNQDYNHNNNQQAHATKPQAQHNHTHKQDPQPQKQANVQPKPQAPKHQAAPKMAPKNHVNAKSKLAPKVKVKVVKPVKNQKIKVVKKPVKKHSKKVSKKKIKAAKFIAIKRHTKHKKRK